MVAKTCKQCGKLFNSLGKDVCHECLDKEKAEFKTVEDFLQKNPGTPLTVICEKTGVDEMVVLKFIKEGKLTGFDKDIKLKCETCGKPITSGRLCPACLNKLSAGLKSAAKASARDEAEAARRGMLSKRLKGE